MKNTLVISFFALTWILPMYPLGIGTVINNGSVPVTITEAGTYVVSEDILYTAVGNTPAVTIAANDVTLDMLGFSIMQTGGLSFSVTAIQLASNSENVVIKNGTVEDFSQSAISVGAGSTLININTVNITGCGNRGIEFVGTAASPITESIINN